MDQQTHPVLVRGSKKLPHLFQMAGIIHLHIGVTEVKLDHARLARVGGAARYFFQRICFQRINAAHSP